MSEAIFLYRSTAVANLILFSSKNATMCPRSSDPFYIVSYYIKWVTTAWTHSSLPTSVSFGGSGPGLFVGSDPADPAMVGIC